ncbi:MAG: AsmA family protein [Candidatus Zapsychrus exili]|nr:AsmA family protein [Candidatus Zapsychrus exili]
MKPIRKRILFIILAFVMLLTIAYLYINKIFLPVKFKSIVKQKGSEFLNRQLDVEEITFDIIKGITAKNIRVYQKDNSGEIFASIDKLTFSFLLPPILKSKKIIIPSIKVINPFINIIKKDSGEWNFSDLIKNKNKSESKSAFQILTRKVELKNGQINITDKSKEEASSEHISPVNLVAELSLPKT